ncbi:Hypothetical protein D9617_4g002130 [Elsinoe fawcettii]|nr:Hypothetical protein D9617_4g002130 [Elsinoe fawcettii]
MQLPSFLTILTFALAATPLVDAAGCLSDRKRKNNSCDLLRNEENRACGPGADANVLICTRERDGSGKWYVEQNCGGSGCNQCKCN